MQTHQHLVLTDLVLPQGNWKQTGEGRGVGPILSGPIAPREAQLPWGGGAIDLRPEGWGEEVFNNRATHFVS